MTIPHFVLVEVDSLRGARKLALEALAQQVNYVDVDKRVPPGYSSALLYGTPEFGQALVTVRMMQRNSLMNCATVLCNIFGAQDAEALERSYHEDPDAFKASIAKAFQYMGLCAAEALIRKRHPPATKGENWTPIEFDAEAFLNGLTEVGVFQDLLEGNYCPDSYFYNPYAKSALIPNDSFFDELAKYSKGRNKKIALVPLMLPGF